MLKLEGLCGQRIARLIRRTPVRIDLQSSLGITNRDI